jgi:topoisomerase-4 subunit B
VPAVELILCRLHAGGKFSNKNYQFSGGLHGVGISVVNALSKRVEVNVRRDGQVYNIAFENGEKVQICRSPAPAANAIPVPASTSGRTKASSTARVFRFSPDAPAESESGAVPGVEITFKDQVNNSEQRWCYADGLNDYLCEAVNGLPTLPEKPFVGNFPARPKRWTGRCCGCRKAASC